MPTRSGWHCGQGTYEASNGFSMATLPYIPATVLTGLQQVVPAEPPASQHLTVSQRDTTTRHPFSTTCFTARGLVASQHQWAEGTWDNLGLVQAQAPGAGIRLPARVSNRPLFHAPSAVNFPGGRHDQETSGTKGACPKVGILCG